MYTIYDTTDPGFLQGVICKFHANKEIIMAATVLEQYATTLTRTFISRTTPETRPRTVFDVTEKGEEELEFVIPHPEEPRHAVSLTVTVGRGQALMADLRFGQAVVANGLGADEAIAAIGEVLDGHIVAITRYKNRNAFDDRRLASSGQAQWLFQMPDDASALTAMTAKLRRSASFMEKLSGALIGVFEVYAWDTREILER